MAEGSWAELSPWGLGLGRSLLWWPGALQGPAKVELWLVCSHPKEEGQEDQEGKDVFSAPGSIPSSWGDKSNTQDQKESRIPGQLWGAI